MATAPNPAPIDLGVLEDCSQSWGLAINASGQVVGHCWKPNEKPFLPFIWAGGMMTQLPLPEGCAAGSAESINASGQVAGWCGTSEEDAAACVWTLEGGGWAVTLLGVPDPYDVLVRVNPDAYLHVVFGQGSASKINDAGQVLVRLGASVTGAWDDEYLCAAIWEDGVWTLPTIPVMGPFPIPLSGIPRMNENGQVLLPLEGDEFGYGNLVLWDAETTTEVVLEFGCANLNNAGQIVGWHYNDDDGVDENFIYDIATGTLSTRHILDDPDDPDDEYDGYSLVNVNDTGQIVVAYPYTGGTTELGIISLDDYMDGTGSVTSLGFVPSRVGHRSVNINAAGEVSGCDNSQTAFFASSSGVVLLDGLHGDDPDGLTQVLAMNDSGAVVGYSDTSLLGGTAPYQSLLTHATLWVSLPTIVDIVVDPSDPVPVNTTISSTARFLDASGAGPHTATWHWGDGETSDGTVDEVSRTVTGAHSYAQSGVYAVRLEVRNSEEDADSAAYEYVFVYDPAEGYVFHTVTYDANGATSGIAPATQTKIYNVALTLATNSGGLARNGYTFSGWNTAADGSGTDYAEGAPYTANAAVTLYAKWANAGPVAIPTLSEWGMILFSLLMAAAAVIFMRKRNKMAA